MDAEVKRPNFTRIRREVSDITACDFYHAIDLPDGQRTRGQWDLRKNVDQYLGGVEFAGKRVLEIGPASGFLSFHMEDHGASVVGIEPPMDHVWDFVPGRGPNDPQFKSKFSSHVDRVRNGYWYLHRLKQSKVELYETSAYALPDELGKFDIGLMAAVLLHTRSPVAIMEQVANLVSDTVIVTELVCAALAGITQPVCRLSPGGGQSVTWWDFTPQFFVQFLHCLGFPNSTVTHHKQISVRAQDQEVDMFTVVARRK